MMKWNTIIACQSNNTAWEEALSLSSASTTPDVCKLYNHINKYGFDCFLNRLRRPLKVFCMGFKLLQA